MAILFWEDHVNSVREGDTYIFKNIRVKDNQYKERYVNPSKNSTDYSCMVAKSYDDTLPEVEVVPDTGVDVQGHITGVTDITTKKSCRACGTKVTPKNANIANCPKCRMTSVLLEWMAPADHVTYYWRLRLTVFSSEVKLLLSLCHLDNTCTTDDLSDGLMMLNDKVQVQYDSITLKLHDIKSI